jgi:hypothetical protein
MAGSAAALPQTFIDRASQSSIGRDGIPIWSFVLDDRRVDFDRMELYHRLQCATLRPNRLLKYPP